MLKKIAETFASRFLISFINFLVVIFTARELGAEARGIIAFIAIGISIANLVSNIIGGPALVYLLPRFRLKKLLAVSWAWAVLSALLVTAIIAAADIIPRGLVLHVFALSALFSLFTVNTYALLGFQKIKAFNILNLLQPLLLILPLVFLLQFSSSKDVNDYIISLYLSYFLAASFSFFSLRGIIKQPEKAEKKEVQLNVLFKQGIFIQAASIFQLFNYRFTYFLLEKHRGIEEVGIYSVAVSVAEIAWLVSKSSAIVQYSSTANTNEEATARKTALFMFKVNAIGGFVVLLALFIVPASAYTFIFGEEFAGIKELVVYLSPAVFIMLAGTSFVNYFSGLGKNGVNTLASFTGLIFLLPAFLLVPAYGLAGAAISALISYTGNLLVLAFLFYRRR